MPAVVTVPFNAATVTAPAAQPAPNAGPSSPQEACGKRTFLALAMCVSEQCQSPQFTSHSQCVKLRQQIKDNQDRMNNGN